MAEQDNILGVILVKKDGKLSYKNKGEEAMYQEFVKSLEEGQSVELFFNANKDTGTNLQLAKIHACIRKLAQEIGYTFEEMKKVIKQRAGLCYQTQEGEYCKSFAVCSVDELGLAIEAIIEAGDEVDVNFRGHLPETRY